jgi:hypothetical protein
MKRNFIVAIIAGLIICTAGITAQAKVSGSASTRSQLASTTQISTGTAVTTKCQMVVSRISVKMANFNNGQTRRVTAYNNLKARISNIISKLDQKGIDTSDLKADLVMLDTKTQKLATDYGTYIARLQETGSYICGKSQGQFMTKLAEAKKLLATVKADVLDIKSFYSTAIRPVIIKLQNALKTLKGSSTPPIKTMQRGNAASSTSTNQ